MERASHREVGRIADSFRRVNSSVRLFLLTKVEDEMITANILTRVLYIKYGQGTGTAFTIEINERQYLITANHVVSGIKDGESISIFHDSNWEDIPVKLINCDKPDVDIIVLAASQQLTPTLPLEPTMDGLVFGQDVYFLGFPFGFFTEDRGGFNNRFPFPFIKKGIISAIDKSSDGIVSLFVDGHNNPGFSGGPIVFVDLNTQKLKVGGVVSGYHSQEAPIYYQGTQLPFVSNLNTGLLVGYGIHHAVDAIKANPIGVKVT
jgi:S1-C subfamily serine protease